MDVKKGATQVGKRCRIVFASASNLLKSPLQLIFMDGRAGKPERTRGGREEGGLGAGFDSDEHGMEWGTRPRRPPTKTFSNFCLRRCRTSKNPLDGIDRDNRQLAGDLSYGR